LSVTISDTVEELVESEKASKKINSQCYDLLKMLKHPDMCEQHPSRVRMLQSSQAAASSASIIQKEGKIYKNYHTSNLLIISKRTIKND